MSVQIFKKYPFHLVSAVVLTVLPLLCSSWITYLVITNEAFLRQFSWQTWGAVTAVCVVTSAVAITPPTFLAMVMGYFLGWQSLILLFILNLLAIALVNGLTLRLDNQKLLSYLSKDPRVVGIVSRFNHNAWQLVFFTKLSPVLPFAMTNLVFSLLGVRLKTLLSSGFVAMIPRTVLGIWVGMQAQQIREAIENPTPNIGSQVVLLVLTVVSIIGVGWYGKRLLLSKSPF
ncbi:MAG: VTT domain-containing protein [Spirosomataceae bacterium]